MASARAITTTGCSQRQALRSQVPSPLPSPGVPGEGTDGHGSVDEAPLLKLALLAYPDRVCKRRCLRPLGRRHGRRRRGPARRRIGRSPRRVLPRPRRPAGRAQRLPRGAGPHRQHDRGTLAGGAVPAERPHRAGGRVRPAARAGRRLSAGLVPRPAAPRGAERRGRSGSGCVRLSRTPRGRGPRKSSRRTTPRPTSSPASPCSASTCPSTRGRRSMPTNWGRCWRRCAGGNAAWKTSAGRPSRRR